MLEQYKRLVYIRQSSKTSKSNIICIYQRFINYEIIKIIVFFYSLSFFFSLPFRNIRGSLQMIKMMVTIVIVFTICWLPFNVLVVSCEDYVVVFFIRELCCLLFLPPPFFLCVVGSIYSAALMWNFQISAIVSNWFVIIRQHNFFLWSDSLARCELYDCMARNRTASNLSLDIYFFFCVLYLPFSFEMIESSWDLIVHKTLEVFDRWTATMPYIATYTVPPLNTNFQFLKRSTCKLYEIIMLL